MSDPFVLDDEPYVLVVPSGAAIPASTISAAEWTALKGRVTVVEGGYTLDQLNDVNTAGVTDGETLVYDAASSTFVVGSSGGTIDRVGNAATTENSFDVSYISLRNGIRFVQSGDPDSGIIFIEAITGNTDTTLATGDHTHAQPIDSEFPIVASGSLSSGTRQLVSGNVTGLAGDRPYLLRGYLELDLRGEGTGAGYTTVSITIGGVTRTRPQSRTVSGVDREVSWKHRGYAVGTLTTTVAVSASIQYDSGDPINVGAGTLFIEVVPYR